MAFKLDKPLIVPKGHNNDDDLGELNMDLDRVHPELRGYARWVPALSYEKSLTRMVMSGLLKLIPKFKGDQNIKVSWIDHDQSRSKIYQPVVPKSHGALLWICLLYTSPSPRDRSLSRMPSSA